MLKQTHTYTRIQLVLNGYEIISGTFTGTAKVCSNVSDTTWLAASRHSIEGYYTRISAATTPLFRITYSGPDTGLTEVSL
jgi:hypothetical protein